jgi:hypothetical protein
MESFDIFSNKKDLIILILGLLLLISITGLYYIHEFGEWLGKMMYRIYIFFYSLFGTLFFSIGQIINAFSNVVANAASLTIDIGNDAVNDVGNLLKGDNNKPREKKNDKHKENMTDLSYMVLPTTITMPSTTTRPQSLASIVQKGTPVPVHYEPSILEYWNIGGSPFA